VSTSLSVVVLFTDVSRALYRVLVSTFPEINLLFGRGTSQAQQHQISVANDCQSVPAARCRCPACPLELQTRCAYLARKHPKGICFSICSYTRPCMPFSCPAYPCAYFYGLRNTFWIVPQWSLRPTLSLVTFSVLPCVPEVPRSCRQLHLHHAQGRQTVWQKYCNVEQGARAG